MVPNTDLLGILGLALGLGVLVCAIMVIVQMFQHGKTGPGIGGIIGLLLCCVPGYLFTLIYGWMKADEWRIKNLMVIYTVIFALNIVLTAMNGPAAYRQWQEQMRVIEQQQGLPANPPAPAP